MNDNLLLTPILFFLLIFTTLMIGLLSKKIFRDRQVTFFSLFLATIWLFSGLELANHFSLLPSFIQVNLLSILTFLIQDLLLFQYLFIGRYLLGPKFKSFGTVFSVAFLIWAVYFSLPSVGIRIATGSNVLLKSMAAAFSLSPVIFYFFYSLYKYFVHKLRISGKILGTILLGLLLPIIVIYRFILLEIDSIFMAFDAIFISLSISIFFYIYVLYLDERRDIFKSFRDKIIIFVFLIVLIPLTFRTSFVYYNTKNILINNAYQGISKEIEYISLDTVSTINSVKKDLYIMSELDSINNLLVNDESQKAVADVLSSYIKQSSIVSKVSILDISGKEKIAVDLRLGYPALVTEENLKDLSNKQFFKEVVAKGPKFVYVSDFNLRTEFGGKKLLLATSVYSGREKTGLIILEISLEDLFRHFLKHDSNHDQYIVDEAGNFIYHPDVNVVNSSRNIKTEIPDLWEKVKTGDEGVFTTVLNKDNYLVAYNKVSFQAEEFTRSFYIIHMDMENEILADIKNLSYIIILTSLVIFILTFILTYLVINYLVNPLINLKVAVENYNSSTDKSVFDINSSQEIEDLSKSFLKLLERLDNSQKEIKEKVAIQTKEISEKSKNLEKQRLAMINLIEDIDSQRELNLKQAMDLSKFKLAIDTVSELIVITDNQGFVIYVNPIVKEITGYSQKETIGSKAGVLWGKQMSKEWYQNFWHVIAVKKETFKGKITNKRKNGEKFIADIIVQPLFDKEGNVQHYVAIQRDVTKEFKIDRMKTDFISLASHQLRTPLSAMRWFLEMFLNGDLGDLTKEQLDAIRSVSDSNTRMISLVNALLNVSRIESGRITVNPKPTDVVALVKDAIVAVKNKFDAKEQKVIYKADTTLPKIMLDPDLVTQTVLNFLTNANKYTDKGGEIRVVVAKKGTDLVVKVSDNGVGIPAKEQKNIFERFYRATNVVQKITDGTGLGLYLAKIIIETLGGKIGFVSKEKQGSTFWFTIPLAGVEKKEGEVSLTLSE